MTAHESRPDLALSRLPAGGTLQEVANACRTGAATNIIYGLALGYKSAIVPVFIVAFIVFGSHTLAGFYGIALSALGMLSTLATCLAIDVYGPVCDNAGGIAEVGSPRASPARWCPL